MRDNRDILEKLKWLSADMEEMEVPGEWLLPVTEAHSIIFREREQVTRLTAEVERLQSIITAADRGSPIWKAVERVMDEKSAWIARPNHEVTNAVALSAGIAWSIHYPLELVDQNLSLQLDNHRLTARVAELEGVLHRIANEPRDIDKSDWELFAEVRNEARAALSPAQPAPSPWRPIETAPKGGSRVLLAYQNSLGKWRRVVAFYAPKLRIEATDDGSDWCEYDDANDRYCLPEGWYECIDNWDDYSYVHIGENTPSHWMPLPPPPEKGGE